jgi:hypothetical protein
VIEPEFFFHLLVGLFTNPSRLDGGSCPPRRTCALWRRICDFEAIEGGCNAPQISRTVRDTRLDDANHYYLLFLDSISSLLTPHAPSQRRRAGQCHPDDIARPIVEASRSHARQSHRSILRRTTAKGRLLVEWRIGLTALEGSLRPRPRNRCRPSSCGYRDAPKPCAGV